MRIVMKNKLGTELDRKQVFHGQQPKFVLINMVRDILVLNDGDTFKFEKDIDIDWNEVFKD